MKPVTVAVTIPEQRERVYAFLDVLGNHESFMDHLFVDWHLSGPRAGVGAKAEVKTAAPVSNERLVVTVVEAESPSRIVEETIGAGGRRRTRGTYLLEDLGSQGTRVSFELSWLELPRGERLLGPLTRAFVRRSNGKAMRRLAKELKKRGQLPSQAGIT
jgi:hypothetical protein